MKLKKQYLFILAAMSLVACNDDKFSAEIPWPEVEEPSDQPEPPAQSSRDELYRPQVHYTPAANWINDPNGLVYKDGVWNMYYQYNPSGNDWGNMSWGHATSSDLIHWTEQPVAMIRNQWGDIFSGSAIVDKDNVAGFGSNAIIAFYTGSGEHQQQCMAYSTDGGITFTQFEGNPVISNTVLGDFRDPKVFWHPESQKWIMCIALGWDCGVELWGSNNLKSWTKLSTFRSSSARSNIGQWECPDLIRLPYKNGEKWVMIVSNNPGGPVGGSGTEYFVGNFDGTEFVADELDYPLWLDYGSDNYAGVTWSNAPDGRSIMIGWMNNWNYCGNVPCNPWRSAMTLPRELSLVEVNGSPLLSTKVVKELDTIAGQLQSSSNGVCSGGSAYEMIVTLDPQENTTFTVGNNVGEYLEIQVNPAAAKIIAKRTSTTGVSSFNGMFSIPSLAAPYNTNASELKLHLYVDASSVEIISEDGTTAITCLVFPSTTYDRINGVDKVDYRVLNSIW